MQFTEVFQQIGGWFIDIAFREVFSSKILITELIGVILFSAVFSNILFFLSNHMEYRTVDFLLHIS